MTTTERSKYIFNKLKREGDCWHDKLEDIGHLDRWYVCSCGKKVRPANWRFHTQNPNFFHPPEGKKWECFGWLWERFRCNQFPWAEFNTWLYIQHRRSIEDLISCTALAEALEKWFRGE